MDYIVYTGQSRIKGEEGCMTIGISKDGFRREYSKIMVITQVLPAQSLRHARAIEKVGIQYMDTVCHRTFVQAACGPRGRCADSWQYVLACHEHASECSQLPGLVLPHPYSQGVQLEDMEPPDCPWCGHAAFVCG